MIAIYKISTLL